MYNVQGREFTNEQYGEPFFDSGRVFTINPYPINRVVSFESLNIENLTASIIVEVCRACDWTPEESELIVYLEWLKKKILTF